MLEYRVHPGGLMRCCLKSLDSAMAARADPPIEGETMHCQYCSDNSGMIFRDGAWEWNMPPMELPQ